MLLLNKDKQNKLWFVKNNASLVKTFSSMLCQR
jgi:hypothetical protein